MQSNPKYSLATKCTRDLETYIDLILFRDFRQNYSQTCLNGPAGRCLSTEQIPALRILLQTRCQLNWPKLSKFNWKILPKDKSQISTKSYKFVCKHTKSHRDPALHHTQPVKLAKTLTLKKHGTRYKGTISTSTFLCPISISGWDDHHKITNNNNTDHQVGH